MTSPEFELLVKFSESCLFIEDLGEGRCHALVDSSWVMLTPEEREIMERVAARLKDGT